MSISNLIPIISSNKETATNVEDVFRSTLYVGDNDDYRQVRTGVSLLTSEVPSYDSLGGLGGESITGDANGNIYRILASGSSTDNRVIKYNSSGVVQWSKTIDGPQWYGDVEADSNGDVIAAKISLATSEVFVYKFSGSNGSVIWKKRYFSAAAQNASFCMKVYGTRIFIVTSNSGFQGITFEVSSADGSLVSSVVNGATYGVYHRGIGFDSINDLMYVVGYTGGTSGSSHASIIKFDISGALTQTGSTAFKYTTIGDTNARAVDVDSSGNLYIAGGINNTNNFVAKFNTNLQQTWVKLFSADNSERNSIAVSSTGKLFAKLGMLNGSAGQHLVSFDPSTGTVLNNSLIINGSQTYQADRLISFSNGNFVVPTTGSDVALIPDSIANELLTSDPINNEITPPASITYYSVISTNTGGMSLQGDISFTPADFAESNLTIEKTQKYPAGDGGLLWVKTRTISTDNLLVDTARGANKNLTSNRADQEVTENVIRSLSADGYIAQHIAGGSFADSVNKDSEDYVAWTFCIAPKFFDIQTWTGDGAASRQISHNLGSTPGAVIVKRSDSNGAVWFVAHKDTPSSILRLESYGEAVSTYTKGAVYASNFTDTTFTVQDGTTNGNDVNGNAGTFVAYIFAHNDGDGEFGPTKDQDIIKCGSYTGNNSVQNIELGFEPQWLLVKNTSTTASSQTHWLIVDNMRQWTADGNTSFLYPNMTASEGSNTYFNLTSTGFQPRSSDVRVNANGENYIYIAIRRGPMGQPESSANVFATNFVQSSATYPNDASFQSGFPVDGILQGSRNTGDWYLAARLANLAYIETASNAAEQYPATAYTFDWSDGFGTFNNTSNLTNYPGYMWQRSPGYFDVVCYTGNNGLGTQTINHSLGVAPELGIFKFRGGSDNWRVYHTATSSNTLVLNDTAAASGDPVLSSPTSTDFVAEGGINGTNNDLIAYLFASLAGVSKVGSYTGNGSTQTIDCGFSSGSKFIIIKRTDDTGNWYFWDTLRGITTGNDPHSHLNAPKAAEVITDDSVDPANAGFIVNQDAATDINVLNASYIFYAIAT